MNQRIKELAEQADKLKRDEVSYLERLHNRYLTGEMEEEIFREKFAEIIVKECAKRSAELGQSEIGLGLLKHFGVEE